MNAYSEAIFRSHESKPQPAIRATPGARVPAVSWVRHASASVVFVLVLALAARVSLTIPGTPVPITLQTLVVTLAAFTLGARWGMLSMVLYWLLGGLGAPVFAEGASGWQSALGPTGGYLLGFVLAQPVMAAVARKDGAFAGGRGLIAALVLGSAVIMASGVTWLAIAIGDLSLALSQGLWPFLPGMVIKSAVALGLGYFLVPWSIRLGR